MPQPTLLFPGQGSQESGMGRDLAESSTEAMNLWKQAEQISHFPLREIFWEGDEAAMSDTCALQPALTVVNVNLWMALAGKIKPLGAAGHSLGEFSALVAAGALSPKDALEITSLRGRLMAEADPDNKGSMAALVKLTLEQAQRIVEEVSSVSNELLLIANYNTPNQFVVSGARDAVSLACAKAKEQKGRGIELKVSGAFHSPMMQEANKELAPLLRKVNWQKPRFPIYCNVHGEAVRDSERVKECILEQMTSSVRWIDAMCNQYKDGARFWLELGPKSLLGKMVAPCLEGIEGVETPHVTLVNDLKSVQDFSL